MWADIITKKRKIPWHLEDVLVKNKINHGDTSINRVMAFGQEVRMTYIQSEVLSKNMFPVLRLKF